VPIRTYAAVLAVAAVVSPHEPWSWHARIVTALACVAVLVHALALGRHRRSEPAPPTDPPPRSRVVGFVLWPLLLGAFAAYQLAIFFLTEDRTTYPTLSSLLNLALEPYPVRTGTLAAWVLFGLYLVRRVPGGPDGRTEPPRSRFAEVRGAGEAAG
jgi:hypothetical protein